MPIKNPNESVSFLENLTLNDKLIAVGYLDFVIYFYFLISMVFLIFVMFIKTPPFDNKLIKRILLLLLTIVWFLLFFKFYFYIFVLLIISLWLSLWKVKDEIKQYFLIKNYHKKELDIDVSENLSTKIVMNWDEDSWDLYNKIWMIQFFNQLFSLFHWMKTIIQEKNEVFWIFLIIIYIFSLIALLVFAFLFWDLFETKYIFISN